MIVADLLKEKEEDGMIMRSGNRMIAGARTSGTKKDEWSKDSWKKDEQYSSQSSWKKDDNSQGDANYDSKDWNQLDSSDWNKQNPVDWNQKGAQQATDAGDDDDDPWAEDREADAEKEAVAEEPVAEEESPEFLDLEEDAGGGEAPPAPPPPQIQEEVCECGARGVLANCFCGVLKKNAQRRAAVELQVQAAQRAMPAQLAQPAGNIDAIAKMKAAMMQFAGAGSGGMGSQMPQQQHMVRPPPGAKAAMVRPPPGKGGAKGGVVAPPPRPGTAQLIKPAGAGGGFQVRPQAGFVAPKHGTVVPLVPAGGQASMVRAPPAKFGGGKGQVPGVAAPPAGKGNASLAGRPVASLIRPGGNNNWQQGNW